MSLPQETGLELQEESREPFFELNRILAALKARDLGPALQWAEENREKLRAQVRVLHWLADSFLAVSDDFDALNILSLVKKDVC